MALFIGTVINRKDKKGRVSVPASFRAALAGQSFSGIVAFPSFRQVAIECCAHDFMEQLGQSLYDINTFSAEQDDLSATLFADAHLLPFDGDGRVILPDALIAHAGITEQVAFVGRGPRFQIWDPRQHQAYAAEARERARRQNLSLKVRPPQPVGRSPAAGGPEPGDAA